MSARRSARGDPRAVWLVLAGLSLAAALPVSAQTQDAGETEQSDESRPQPAPTPLEDHASTAVTGALQGKEGVRIQTLCTHCNSANIQLGGLSRDLVPMSRDGFPIVGGLQTSFVLSVLPADSIAEAQVVKGPGDAAQSHAAAGGEISLTGSPASEMPLFDFFAETGSYSLRRGSARLAGSLAPWASGAIVLGTTEADPVDDDNDGWVDVPAVDRRFAEANLQLSPGSKHQVWLGASVIDEENTLGRGAFDAVRYVTEQRDGWTREDTVFRRQEIRAGWEWRSPSGGALELRALGAARDQQVSSQLTALSSGFIEGADRLIDRFDIEEQNLWSVLSYEQPLGLRWRVEGGVEASRQDVDAVNREPLTIIGGSEPVEQAARETVDLTSVYLNVGWSPSQAWDLQLGLRRDQADFRTELSGEAAAARRSDSEVSPRITVRYFPARGWMLRLVAGDTFRPPTPILAEVCCGQRYQTTENVVPERGRTVGFEAEYVPTPRLRASAYVARTDFDNHLLRVVGWSQVFIQTYALANIPRSTADRAELALRWSALATLTFDASLGWLSFKNTGEENVDVHVTPPSFAGPIVVPIRIDRVPYQAVRSGSVSASWTLPGRTILSAQTVYTGSMWIQQFERLPSNSELNTDEMRETPDFWLVNLSAQVPLNRHVSLFGGINNAGNRIQDDLGDPTTDYNWGPLAGRSWQAGVKVHLGR